VRAGWSTEPEAATTIVNSPSTILSHRKSIYIKLGISSRVEDDAVASRVNGQIVTVVTSRRRSIHHRSGDLPREITSEGRQERSVELAPPRTARATAGTTRRGTTTPQPGVALIVGPSPPTP
jgi:hypothetical protein